MESYEESYLISSRFTLDSRIGGIGGLVESSADLWRWSPITMDPLWLFNIFGIPAVSRIPEDSRIPVDSRIADSRIPDSCWSRDLTFLTNLLSFVLSTSGVPSHRNEGLSVVVSSPEKNHNKYVSLLHCSPHSFTKLSSKNFQGTVAASMYFWSVSWSTNCLVYFSFFLVNQRKICPVSDLFCSLSWIFCPVFFENVVLVSLLADQLSGQDWTKNSREWTKKICYWTNFSLVDQQKNCPVSGNLWSVSESFC